MNKVAHLIDRLPEAKPGVIVQWANTHIDFTDNKHENKIFKDIISQALEQQKARILKAMDKNRPDQNETQQTQDKKTLASLMPIYREIYNFTSHWFNAFIKDFKSSKYEVYLFYDEARNAEIRYRTNNLNEVSGPFLHINALLNAKLGDLKASLNYFFDKRNYLTINDEEYEVFSISAEAEIRRLVATNPLLEYFASQKVYEQLATYYKYDSLQEKTDAILNNEDKLHDKTNEEQRAEFIKKLDANALNKDNPKNKSNIKSVFKN